MPGHVRVRLIVGLTLRKGLLHPPAIRNNKTAFATNWATDHIPPRPDAKERLTSPAGYPGE
jgi:hypothetical protein